MMRLLSVIISAASLLYYGNAVAEVRIADVHTHYKWSQVDVTSPEDVIKTLEAHNVELAVVIGTPAELALKVSRLSPEKIIPIWSPYRVGGDWSRWAFDLSTLDGAREALASGQYKGVGELHLIGGFAPKFNSPVIDGLFELAASYDVPVLLHTELSREDYLVSLCNRHKETRILWAHAGSILPVDKVKSVLTQCSNVWIELSARDPWRFINHPMTDEQGKLLPEWEGLMQSWPDRFMIGSDPVWPVDQLDGWDVDDTGWQEYHRFIGFHTKWLDQLGKSTAKQVRFDNAWDFFLKPGLPE